MPRKRILVGHALKSDRSPPLRSMDEAPIPLGPETEASPNPRGVSQHVDRVDTVRQDQKFPPNMPAPGLSFDGIQYGAVSNLAPPDTNGEAGLTQYVQTVNSGYQVFDKATGASLLGPVTMATLWQGFGGVCQFNGRGDPVVLYDHFRFPSCFKARPLVVTRVGTGRGSISSSPAGLGCRAACSGLFADGATVTLSATAGPSSLFRGWSGDCHGTGACVVSMTGGHSVTATFQRPLAPPVCRVPKAVGTTLARPRTMIAKAHCRVGKISRKATRAGKRGKVLGQSPKASKRLKSGAKVNLTVGK